MPRKKGVAKIPTVIHLVPRAKYLLERMAEEAGRPANHIVEDLVMDAAEARGLAAAGPEFDAWLSEKERE